MEDTYWEILNLALSFITITKQTFFNKHSGEAWSFTWYLPNFSIGNQFSWSVWLVVRWISAADWLAEIQITLKMWFPRSSLSKLNKLSISAGWFWLGWEIIWKRGCLRCCFSLYSVFLCEVAQFCVTKLIYLCFCLFQRSADGSSAEDGDGKFEKFFCF